MLEGSGDMVLAQVQKLSRWEATMVLSHWEVFFRVCCPSVFKTVTQNKLDCFYFPLLFHTGWHLVQIMSVYRQLAVPVPSPFQ